MLEKWTDKKFKKAFILLLYNKMTDKITLKQCAAEDSRKTESKTKTLVACLTLALAVLFHQGWFAETITTQDAHQTPTEFVISPDSAWWDAWSDWWKQSPTWSLRGLPWESRVEPIEETPEETAERTYKKFLDSLKCYH